MNDEAEVVAGLWSKIDEAIWFHTGERTQESTPLVRYLNRGRGGRRVSELGLDDDIDAAAQLNSFEHHRAFELKRDPFRIVAVG